jgi:DNA-binding response OmpR family regulator
MHQPLDQPLGDQPLRDRYILVVEDDPFIALDVQNVLQMAGATVVGPAHVLSEASRLVHTCAICAAVLDYRLQKGDTLALARELAERRIPFLFQTSDPTGVADKYPQAIILAKPFEPQQLIAALDTLLRGS